MVVLFKVPGMQQQIPLDWKHGAIVVCGLAIKYAVFGYVVRMTGMGDPMFLPFLGIFGLFFYNMVRWIVAFVSKDEKTEFFKETVEGTYEPKQNDDAIVAYERLKTGLMDKVAAAQNLGPDLPADWAKHMGDNERKVLMMSLRKRMFRNIDCLAAIERDKPGKYKLWRHKLVSEEVWESLTRVEDTVTKEIDECVLEAEELQPGWGKDLFQEVLDMWRRDQHREMQEEHRKKQVEERQQKQAKEREDAKPGKTAKQQEEEAEKLAAELAKEEELEEKRRNKGKNAGAKKKGKK